jgi:uncharacterized protein YkwD
MANARKLTHITRRALRALAPLAVVSAVALAPASADAASTCKGADADPGTTNLQTVKHATLCLLNQQRRSHGLKKLKANDRLSLASQRHAKDMVSRGYFEHGNFVGRIKATRYLAGTQVWTVGENIAWGAGELSTPEEIVNAWMHSPPHRHNILSGKFREIGIGVARGVPVRSSYKGATYATDFGARK